MSSREDIKKKWQEQQLAEVTNKAQLSNNSDQIQKMLPMKPIENKSNANQNITPTEMENIIQNAPRKAEPIKNLDTNKVNFWDRVKLKAQELMSDTGKTLSNFALGAEKSGYSMAYYTDRLTNRGSKEYQNISKKQQAEMDRKNQGRALASGKQGTQTDMLPIAQNLITNAENYNNYGKNVLLKRSEENKSENNIIQQNAEQILNQKEQQIAENTESINNKVLKKASELMPSIGQSVTGMAVSALNPVLGAEYFTASAGGDYTREAKKMSYNDNQADVYGTVMGAMEGVTEMIGGALTKNIGTKVASQGIVAGLKDFGIDIAENFFEESIMEPIQESVKLLVGKNGDWQDIGKRMLQSGIDGALTSIIMGGASAGIGSCVNVIEKMQNGTATETEIKQAIKDANSDGNIDFESLVQQAINNEVSNIQDTKQSINESQNQITQETEANLQKVLSKEKYANNEKAKTFFESANNNNLDIGNEKVEALFDLPNKRGIDVKFDTEVFKNQDGSINKDINALYVTDKNGKRSIVYNPEANLDSIVEKNAMHETFHDMTGTQEGKEVIDFIYNRMKESPEFQEAFNNLKQAYSNQKDSNGRILYNTESTEFNDLIKEEAVADYLGTNLGNQEYINELVNGKETRNIAQRIYDAIVKFLDNITGYKSEEAFLRGVKDKFEKAFNVEYARTEGQKYSIQDKNRKLKLQDRVSGDALLDAQDFIDELKSVGADVDENGYVTVYHQTSSENANNIKKSGKMSAKEDGIFFSTSKNAQQSEGRGSEKLKFKIPVEMLQLDDIFDNNADVKIPLENKNKVIDISQYLVNENSNKSSFSIEKINSKISTEGNINKLTDDGITMSYVHMNNQNTADYGTTYGQNIEPSGEYMSMDTMQGKYKIPGADYGMIHFNNPLILDHINTSDTGWKKTLSEMFGGKTKKSLTNAIKKAGYDAIMTVDEDGNYSEIVNINGEKQNNTNSNLPKKQFDIIKNSNAMTDDYHVGIRSVEDIKTFEEAIKDDESFVYGDYSLEDAQRDLEKGTVTVYSSKPISQGGFVSTSKNMAQDYAGNGKVYSKEVNINDVAWINGDEGQYAKIDDFNSKYSISQDTRRNIEHKIDRYERLIDQMQKEGRASDEWAVYSNEILRLQDQLESPAYSTAVGKWQEFLDKNKIGNGTTTQLGEIRLPERKITIDNYNEILDSTQYIPAEDKKELLKQLEGLELNKNSLKEFEQVVKDMDSAYKQLDEDILNTQDTYSEGRKNKYNQYMKAENKYDNTALENAKEIVPANASGRRTKEQWLNIAKQMGTEISNKSNAEIEEIAYRTWQDERPSQKSNLNRQGQGYVSFSSDEWINTIYDSAKQARENVRLPASKTVDLRIESNNLLVATEENDEKQRKHYKSIKESEYVGEQGKEIAKKLLKKDTYTPISNVDTISKANEFIRTSEGGIDGAYHSVINKLKGNERITLQDIARGELLIQEFSNNGDYEKASDLINAVAVMGTELGQQVQALSLIKKQTPAGQLNLLQKVVDRTNSMEGTELQITNEMKEKILSTKNQEQLDSVISEITENLGNQLKVTLGDEIRSWRYLSMLGNPKTHIRNLGANIVMNVTQNIKNGVAGFGEDVASIFNENLERTKTLKMANADQRAFAKQDAIEMQDLIDGGGKYDISNQIQQSKKSSNIKLLNAVEEFNTNLLDIEDKIFLKTAYKQAMQGYMSANNLSSADMKGATLQKAREYASLQAQEATFHQFSALANTLTQVENKGGIGGKLLEAILPFKKTPLNIAKTGLEYSPVGLASSIGGTINDITRETTKYRKQLEDGKITQEQYNSATSKLVTDRIDKMAKGLTGTALSIIGYSLAKSGLLKAGNEGDKDEFEEKLGSQTFSVKIGDNTYTLDWLSPSAIPLFVGASIQQLLSGESDDTTTLNSLATGLAKAFEPMTEMSMLQGLTSAISSYEQGSSNIIFDFGASAVSSYAGQFIPTALGQVTKTVDPYVRDTTSTEKGLSKKVDQFKKQSMAKIPGLSSQLPVKQDIWGQDKKREGGTVQRYLENAILPYNRQRLINDRTTEELEKVFEQTGEKSVLPTTSSLQKTLTINGEKNTLTSEEYNNSKKIYGQTANKTLNALLNTNEYKKLSAEDKSKLISNVYSYAKEAIKVDYANNKNIDYESTNEMYNTLTALNDAKVRNSTEIYTKYLAGSNNLESAEEKINYLENMKIPDEAKTIIYENDISKGKYLSSYEDNSYNNLKKLTKDNVSTDYLDYKAKVKAGYFKSDVDKNGKAISGSAKSKVINYLNNSNMSDVEKLYIYIQNGYKISDSQKKMYVKYVNNLNISNDEKSDLLKRIK